MRNIHVCCYGNQAGKKKETFGPTELKDGGPELNLLNIILKSPGEISALLFLLVMFVNTVHILLLMMF